MFTQLVCNKYDLKTQTFLNKVIFLVRTLKSRRSYRGLCSSSVSAAVSCTFLAEELWRTLPPLGRFEPACLPPEKNRWVWEMYRLLLILCHFSTHCLHVTRERAGSSDMRLSTKSWSISSALRKREKGRKRRAQQRASMQVEFTSEPAGFWATQTHAFIFIGHQQPRMITHKHDTVNHKLNTCWSLTCCLAAWYFRQEMESWSLTWSIQHNAHSSLKQTGGTNTPNNTIWRQIVH